MIFRQARQRTSGGRRIVALALALFVAFSPLEALIPEVHDGDADAVACAASATSSDATAIAALQAGVIERAIASVQATSHDTQPSDAPRHGVHVDHCTHGHAVVMLNADPDGRPAIATTQRYRTSVPRISSVARAPRLRPPIIA